MCKVQLRKEKKKKQVNCIADQEITKEEGGRDASERKKGEKHKCFFQEERQSL